MVRLLGLIVLAVTLTSASSAVAQGAKEGKSDPKEAPTVVARWKHQPGNNVNTLYSNGKVNDPSGEHTWTLKNNILVFRWKDAKAPGGFWIDTVTVSPDGQTYKGTNQLRHPINGVLVKDPSAKA